MPTDLERIEEKHHLDRFGKCIGCWEVYWCGCDVVKLARALDRVLRAVSVHLPAIPEAWREAERVLREVGGGKP